MLVNHNNQKTGFDKNGAEFNEIPNARFIEQGILANRQNPSQGAGNGYGSDLYLEPKPDKGTYILYLYGEPHQEYSAELFAFKQDGASQFIPLSGQLNGQGKQVYLIGFDPDSSGDETTAKQVSFQTFKEAIDYAYQQGWFKYRWVKQQLLRYLNLAEGVYQKSPSYGRRIIRSLPQILGLYRRYGLINAQAYELLSTEAQALAASL